jgi:starch phosphorylase
MYPQGYFRQRISAEGWQQEIYVQLDWAEAPVSHARTIDDRPCVVMVPLGSRSVLVQVWQVRLGRVRLLLLDTALEQNAPWDRELSARLYGGGHDTRLQQEIVLGLGGVLALRALGLSPAVWHLNEGHAAFVILQRLRDFLAAGRTWEEALVEVRRTTVFTTHTPVAAGHDAFPFHLVEQQLAACWGSMNGNAEHFMQLGHYDTGNGPQFNMTALAMRSSGAINGVSQICHLA